jgi:aminomethyltransferase
MKKSAFFDFLNRRENLDFDGFLSLSQEDEDYINWNEFVLPQQYGLDSQSESTAESEYQAIRNSCAIFDVSPIRKIQITGSQAGRFLDYVLSRPVSAAPSMRGIYVAFCNDDGSLKDDSILYKYAGDDYMLMPSDIDHCDYFELLRQRLEIPSADLHIRECTDDWCGMAVQGPHSAAVLANMGFAGVEELAPFAVADYPCAQGSLPVSAEGSLSPPAEGFLPISAEDSIRIARMGFTADLGYECWLSPEQAQAFTQGIEKARQDLGIAIPGYGLRALEACRLEGGFVVAGWDFATEIDPDPDFQRSPFEVGLGWLVKLNGSDFVGRDALVQQQKVGQTHVLRGMKTQTQVKPADGTPVFAMVDGKRQQQVGSINCSAWSWGMQLTIGNISLAAEFANLEAAWFEQGGSQCAIDLTQGPMLVLARRNTVPAALQIGAGDSPL